MSGANVIILMLNKVNVKTKRLSRNKRSSIMIKVSICQDITILNVDISNNI